jgi:predicted amidophosphoribosyltransferase
MRCPSCDAENPDATKFCGNCGQALRSLCARRGSENPHSSEGFDTADLQETKTLLDELAT